MEKFIKLNLERSVATITINNPPANVLNSKVIMELGEVLNQIESNNEIKVCVITGSGMFFVAGADIKEIAEIKSADKGSELSLAGQKVINRIEDMNKPFIAAINGICLGGGLELAMACHIRVASERAKLGQPEINLGIIPGFGGTQRLARLVGVSKAYKLILTGEMISGREAETIGLVDKALPETELMREAIGLAKRIGELHGAPSIEFAIKAIREGYKLSLKEGLALESELFGKLCETEDMREGLSAFLEKRQPKFKNK